MILDAGIKERIRSRALALGFDAVGFAPASSSGQGAYLQQWLEMGRHGEMQWMARNAEKRKAVAGLMPEAHSIVVVGINCNAAEPPENAGTVSGLVARYARFEDYHRVIENKLKQLSQILREEAGETTVSRWYVDTGPVLERDLARRAGLGWQGKSTVLISREFGTWLLLGELLTSAEIPPDEPAKNHCGQCTRCMDACPTNAIIGEYQLDARRCIAYLTIELKGAIPTEFRRAIGDRVFGCDDCLAVCPWNRFAKAASSFRQNQRQDLSRLGLIEIMGMGEEAFLEKFARTPVKRLGLRRLKRNAAVVLGNVGGARDLEILKKVAGECDELVAEHARWAIAEIKARSAS